MPDYSREAQLAALKKVLAEIRQAVKGLALIDLEVGSILELHDDGRNDPELEVGQLFVSAGEVEFPAKHGFPAYKGPGFLVYAVHETPPRTRGGEVLDAGDVDIVELAVCPTALEAAAAVLAENVRLNVMQAAEGRYEREEDEREAADDARGERLFGRGEN